MLEAIDTVMSKEQCQQAIDNYEYRHLSRLEAQLHAQAEISFPKGEKQGIDKGRKEVVEWIDNNCLGCQSNTPSNTDEYLGFHKNSWQAFKKKLGL